MFRMLPLMFAIALCWGLLCLLCVCLFSARSQVANQQFALSRCDCWCCAQARQACFWRVGLPTVCERMRAELHVCCLLCFIGARAGSC